MAVPFSHLSVRLSAPKSRQSAIDHYCSASGYAKCHSLSHVNSWRSAANYVALHDGRSNFTGKPLVSKHLMKRRVGVWKCATIEEIEAEKSLIENDAKERMEKTIETIRSNFNAVRSGRANPAMLDRVEVEYYGSPVSLKSIAQISTPDASSLLIQPYDKSSLKAIEKAIVSSDLDLTPNNDGEVIRLSVPQLTSERRKEMSKIVAKQAEEGKFRVVASKESLEDNAEGRTTMERAYTKGNAIKHGLLVAIRNIRRDAIKAYEKLEKEKKLSEDNVKDLSSDLQKLTDSYMKKIESLQAQKEKELLKV